MNFTQNPKEEMGIPGFGSISFGHASIRIMFEQSGKLLRSNYGIAASGPKIVTKFCHMIKCNRNNSVLYLKKIRSNTFYEPECAQYFKIYA